MADADWPGGGANEAGRKKKCCSTRDERDGTKIRREGGDPSKRILGGTEDGENGNRVDW